MIKLNVKKFSEFSMLLAGGIIFLIALNLMFFLLFGDVNLDLTKDKKYSLSDETISFLKNNKERVNIRFFVSKDLKSKNPQLAEYAEYLRKLFVEYKNKSNGYIDLVMVDVVPFENSQFEAEKFGVTEFNLGDGVKYQFLGASFSNINGQSKSIPQLIPQRKENVEDDITRMLAVVTKNRKPYVGVVSSLFSVADEWNPLKNTNNWPFVDAMEDFGYNVIPMNDTVPYINDAIDVVLVLYPFKIDTPFKYALDQYLVKGGRVVILMDAFFEERFRDREKYYSYNSGLKQFLQHYGVSYDEFMLVGDNVSSETIVMDGKKVKYPLKINVNKSMMTNHLVNKNIDLIRYNHGGYFEYEEQDGLIITAIVQTSKNSGLLLAEELTDLDYSNLEKNYVVTDENYALSLLIEGKFTPYYSYPPFNDPELISKLPVFINASKNFGKLFLLGDADIVNEVLWNKNSGSKSGVFNISYSSDNMLFLRNVLDYMSDSNYSNVGKKNVGEHKVSLTNVFQIWANDFYKNTKKEINAKLFNVRGKLAEIKAKKAELEGLSIQKLKDEEQLVREEMDLNQSLRKTVYLTGEKYKFYISCFSAFIILVMPMFVVLVIWWGYVLYNHRLVKKAKEYVDD